MKYIFILFVQILTHSIFADENIPKKPVELGLQVIEINHQKYLSINYKNYPEWHTYWKNPGDAGLAIESKIYNKDKEINLSAEEWPIPQKFIEQGDLWAFGYHGDYSLFYKLDKNFQTKYFGTHLTLKSKWLVCKNICVPGQLDVNFKITRDGVQLNNSELLNPLDSSSLEQRFFKLPKTKSLPDYLELILSKGDKAPLLLTYKIKNTIDNTYLKNANMLYPFTIKPFDFKHEIISIGENSISGSVDVDWDGQYQTPPEELNPNGNFKKPYVLKFLFNDPILKETYVIEKKFSAYVVLKAAQKKNEIITTTSPQVAQGNSIIYYLALAFIGGMILNVMPCVLPVISLKLFGLIKHQKESRSRIIRHNLFYTLGILATFSVLAFTIIALKYFGTSVGWGFQLQSPNFIAIMIIVLFIFSLNLFGLFEFRTPGGHKLGGYQSGHNVWGDFVDGILATILSTPCSAPFLGTALTFAFTSNAFTIFSMFIMIGLGLASPFIITGIFPSLVFFLPKPGNWMNTFKKFLGATLLLTNIWLLDVFYTLVGGQNHFLKLLLCLLFIYLALFLKKKEKWIIRALYIFSLLLLVNIFNTAIMEFKESESALIRDKQASGLKWEAWSQEKMDIYKTNNQVVFIDFTAKWCFTCKVNERLVLDTDEFKNFVEKNNINLLIGDWTKRDEVIGDFLMKHKLVGVPAYFIQKADGTLISLGETVTISKIKENL